MDQITPKRRKYSHGPECRIKKRPRILEIQESGKKHYSKHFLLIIDVTEGPVSRLAVTITKKVDKRAVSRNRLRRRLREVFRLNKNRLRDSFDILIIARKNAASIGFEQIRKEILGVLYHNRYFIDAGCSTDREA